MPDDTQDSGIIGELAADHRAVQQLFDRIRAAAPGSAERKDLADRVTIDLVRHGAVEKEHLYPAVRRYLPRGTAWADRGLANHAGIERVLKELDQRRPDDEEFGGLLVELVTLVTAHSVEEEQRLFPLLQAVCPAAELRELGEKVRADRPTAPTRPRPPAPQAESAGPAVLPGTGLLDRVRDVLTRRGRRAGGP